jgi:hypothetical protein
MSSLAIFTGGRSLGQRSSPTTAPSIVDAKRAPQILTSCRAATENAIKQCSPLNRTSPLLRSTQMREFTNEMLPCSSAYRDDAVVGLVATRSLNSNLTDRHKTAGVAVPCLSRGPGWKA